MAEPIPRQLSCVTKPLQKCIRGLLLRYLPRCQAKEFGIGDIVARQLQDQASSKEGEEVVKNPSSALIYRAVLAFLFACSVEQLRDSLHNAEADLPSGPIGGVALQEPYVVSTVWSNPPRIISAAWQHWEELLKNHVSTFKR